MISPAIVRAIRTRYQQGATVPTIAQELGVSADTIKRHLRAAGITLRDDRARGTGPTATADRIAAAGATTRQVRAWARDTGLPVPLAGPVPGAIIDAYLSAHPQHDQHDDPDTEQEHHPT